MLPFQSRNVRDQHSDEDINTDDVEVVHHVRNAAQKATLLAPSSKRQNLASTLRSTGVSSKRHAGPASRTAARNEGARVPAPIPASRRAPVQASVEVFSEPEDEMTCLMPSKLILPPAAKRANELQAMSFRPQPQAPAHRFSPTTPQPMRTMSARQESMHETHDSYTFARVPAPPASLAPMAMPSVDSDPRINPGATVLTSRSLAGRPTVSWAAALVVMGIFAGLVTAAVARGDLSGDAKVAAASQQPAVQQVIPSSAQAQLAAASQPAASPASPSMMGAFYNSGTSSSMALSAPVSAGGSQVVAAQPVAIQQPVAAPIAAKFTPAPRAAAPRAAAPAAPAPVAHVAKPEVKEKKEVVASKSKKESKSDDLASAKEAQALADAQLAASL